MSGRVRQDPEEQALLAEVERQNQERNKALYDRDLDEQRVFEERRVKAQEDLHKWHEDRFKKIEKKREQNHEAERAFYDYLKGQTEVGQRGLTHA